MPEARLTLRLRITGRVQGVGYRYWAQGEAERIGLSGWVRNCSDGCVEVLVSGEDAAVETFIERARIGPPAARVTAIERRAAEPPERAGFRALPTD